MSLHTTETTDTLSSARAMALERAAAFLATDAAYDEASGLWRGWVPPSGQDAPPPYEEATAWVLLGAAMMRDEAPDAGVASGASLRPRIERAADVIANRALQHGGLRRDGRRWLFDTGVGLLALHRLGGFEDAVQALARGMDELLAAGIAVEGGPPLGEETPASRWSEAFGAHLLWLVLPLQALGRTAEAEKLVDALLPRFVRRRLRADGGVDEWLAVHARSDACYAHGACYGIRGLLSSEDARQVHVGRRCVETLLRACRADGVAPAWLAEPAAPAAASPSNSTAEPRWRADATVQLHALADTAYGGRVPAGLPFRTATSPALPVGDAGGLRYGVDGQEPSAGHENVWVTAFALMAAIDPRRAAC